ncbi:MAG: hypothetical protein LUE63_03750 [Lachnospiraceae bacterium]|nr:hypothetical protein [Lachnospiraceae bacterium]
MALIKCFDKRVGITYVYESESYYDKEKHQSRSRRKLVGKIDPETGEIIPTGRKGRPSKNPSPKAEAGSDLDYQKLYEKISEESAQKDEMIARLERQLFETKELFQKYKDAVEKVSGMLASLK